MHTLLFKGMETQDGIESISRILERIKKFNTICAYHLNALLQNANPNSLKQLESELHINLTNYPQCTGEKSEIEEYNYSCFLLLNRIITEASPATIRLIDNLNAIKYVLEQRAIEQTNLAKAASGRK